MAHCGIPGELKYLIRWWNSLSVDEQPSIKALFSSVQRFIKFLISLIHDCSEEKIENEELEIFLCSTFKKKKD